MDTVAERIVRQERIRHAFGKLIGEATTFRRAIRTAAIASSSDAAILLIGETGTGKELIARAIHYLSDRTSGPFVAVNCGSLPDTLLEDELFGHERGAFTDAQQRRIGLVAHAERGTLFLDEIDTLSARGQAAILRLVQDKVYRPLGTARESTADIRFIAATNTHLSLEADKGIFRADLYYRLSVFTIDLPSLRDRRADIALLASHFIQKHTADDATLPTLSAAARVAMTEYPWPGNVRELENSIIRGIRLSEANVIDTDHLGLRVEITPEASIPGSQATFREQKRELIKTFELKYLMATMREADGNVTRAARIAGKDRRDFGKLLSKYGLMGRNARRPG